MGIVLSGEAQPCFYFMGDSVGCAPFKVRIKSCYSGPNVSYSFNWPTDPYVTIPDAEIEHEYATPGTYIIEQYLGGQNRLQRTVRVFNINTLPTFSWTTCQDTLKIQFADTVFRSFRFDPGDASGVRVLNGGRQLYKYRYSFGGTKASFSFRITGDVPTTCSKTPVTDTVTLYKTYGPPPADSLIGVDTLHYRTRIRTRADEPYGFQRFQNGWLHLQSHQTRTDDPSALNSIAFPNLNQPDTIRAVTLTGCGDTLGAPYWVVVWPRTTSDNQKITLTWPSFSVPDLVEFSLLRNDQVIAGLLGKTDTVYVDSGGLQCGQDYCYRFRLRRQVAGYPGNLVYLSAPICAQATSNEPASPVKNITATVQEDGILVSAKPSPIAKTYTLFRREKNGGLYTEINQSNKLPILDTTADFNHRAYCYRIGFLDICGNISRLSDSICPVWLRIDTPNDAEKDFVWTSMDGWKGGVNQYLLYRFSEGDSPQFYDVEKTTSFTLNRRDSVGQLVCYQIRSFAENPTDYPGYSTSNKVCLEQKAKLLFPDVFTPNDDRANDDFRCYNLFIKEFELKIFNHWGEIIYYSTDPKKGWNGKVDGKPAASGGYAYWAQATDELGHKLKTKGYFMLVR